LLVLFISFASLQDDLPYLIDGTYSYFCTTSCFTCKS